MEKKRNTVEALVVIDMQNDFIDGPLGTPEARAVLPRVTAAIRAFEGPVLFTRDTHDEDYARTQEGRLLPVPHCVKGTHGWQLHPAVEALRRTTPFDKPTFASIALAQALQAKYKYEGGLSRITLVGVCTDICVISNALLLKAFLPEVPVRVDASLCAGVTPEGHATALDAMRACQIEIAGA